MKWPFKHIQITFQVHSNDLVNFIQMTMSNSFKWPCQFQSNDLVKFITSWASRRSFSAFRICSLCCSIADVRLADCDVPNSSSSRNEVPAEDDRCCVPSWLFNSFTLGQGRVHCFIIKVHNWSGESALCHYKVLAKEVHYIIIKFTFGKGKGHYSHYNVKLSIKQVPVKLVIFGQQVLCNAFFLVHLYPLSGNSIQHPPLIMLIALNCTSS